MPVFTVGDYEFYLFESYVIFINKTGLKDTKIGYLIIHSQRYDNHRINNNVFSNYIYNAIKYDR